jgi:hypothetical protein
MKNNTIHIILPIVHRNTGHNPHNPGQIIKYPGHVFCITHDIHTVHKEKFEVDGNHDHGHGYQENISQARRLRKSQHESYLNITEICMLI